MEKISQRKFVKAVGEVGTVCVRRDINGTSWRTPDGKVYAEFWVGHEDFIYWRVG